MSETIQKEDRKTLTQVGTVRGTPFQSGWKFVLTKPLKTLGITPDTLRANGEEVVIRFNDPVPEAGMVTGVVKTGSDMKGARRYSNQRKIDINNASLKLSLPDEELHRFGVDCDLDEGIPPVVEVWVGDGVIMLKNVEMEEITVHNVQSELEKLPEKMRRDFIAVEHEGMTPEEVADERGLKETVASPEGTDKEYEYKGLNVTQNVKKARKMLSDPEAALEALQHQDENEELVEFVPTNHREILDGGEEYDSYRITITETTRKALPDDAVGEEATELSLQFDTTGDDGVVPAAIDTGSDAVSGRGRDRIRKVNVKSSEITAESTPDELQYGVKLPMSVIEALELGDTDIIGEYVMLYAGDNSIAITTPQEREFVVEEPELKKSKRAQELEGHSGNNWYLDVEIDGWNTLINDLANEGDAEWVEQLAAADVESVEGRKQIEEIVTNDVPVSTVAGSRVYETYSELRDKYDSARHVEWGEQRSSGSSDDPLWLAVDNVGVELAQRLVDNGFETPEDVLGAELVELTNIKSLGRGRAQQIRQHARKVYNEQKDPQ